MFRPNLVFFVGIITGLIWGSFLDFQVSEFKALTHAGLRGLTKLTRGSAVTNAGSGFVVSRDGYILTNHHVVEDCDKVTTRVRGEDLTLKVLTSDSENDLALLKMPREADSAAVFRQSPSVELGEQVIALGFPLQWSLSSTPKVTTGEVSSLAGYENNSRELQISTPVQGGNSGSPLLDRAGNVIGVVASSLIWGSGERPQNVNFAVRGTLIRLFLDAHEVKYQLAISDERLGIADIVKETQKYTFPLSCWG